MYKYLTKKDKRNDINEARMKDIDPYDIVRQEHFRRKQKLSAAKTLAKRQHCWDLLMEFI